MKIEEKGVNACSAAGSKDGEGGGKFTRGRNDMSTRGGQIVV